MGGFGLWGRQYDGRDRAELRDRAAEAGEQAGGVVAGEFVLPDPEDAPAHGAEGAGDAAVAGAVGGDLLAPKSGVLLGLRGMERAAMPEAAVDEDGEAVRAEDEVGHPAEGFFRRARSGPAERGSSAPAREAVGAEERDEAQFGGGAAARADGGLNLLSGSLLPYVDPRTTLISGQSGGSIYYVAGLVWRFDQRVSKCTAGDCVWTACPKPRVRSRDDAERGVAGAD